MNTFKPIKSILLDGNGGATDVSVPEAAQRSKGKTHWLHLDYKDPASLEWLQMSSGIDEVILEALLAEDPRPRSLVHADGLLLILRGANLNPGAAPEDMVSLRLWVEADRVITFRHRRLITVQEVVDQLMAGDGPTSPGDILQEIVACLLLKIGVVVNTIEESTDELEELVLSAESRELRSRLSALRRQSIMLRRFIAPQRDTIGRLSSERVTWLDDSTRARLREAADRTTRYIEDLDAARDRAAVTYEELTNRLTEQMNATMYRLSIVAAIFLPLGLLTGLLGINVGGIPGTESPIAFSIVCGGLLALGILEWWWFKRRSMV